MHIYVYILYIFVYLCTFIKKVHNILIYVYIYTYVCMSMLMYYVWVVNAEWVCPLNFDCQKEYSKPKMELKWVENKGENWFIFTTMKQKGTLFQMFNDTIWTQF